MSPEEVRKMLEEVLRQHSFGIAWWSYAVFAIIAALSGYLGAYLKKKGEAFASREEFNALLDQTRKTSEVTEEIRQAVARRSGFESQVVLDQYKLATSLQNKLTTVSTDLGRLHSGQHVPDGFITDHGDIVQLTEIFETLFANQWLLGNELYGVLFGQADWLLKSAQASDPALRDEYTIKWLKCRDEFAKKMTAVFQLGQIIA